MNYFFRCQESTFNLENKKMHISRKYFSLHVTESTYSRIILRAICACQGYIQNFERNCTNSICIRVKDTHWEKAT